jgi:ligand-binding sensor domain-containing protein/putative methionine-R-sulfoxide reductase with GAF domain
MMQQRTWNVLFMVLLAGRLAGQSFSENGFIRYTTAEGMSHNTVAAIKQDSIGYIWAATFSGLNRFNGTRFVQFHSNSDSLSLDAEDMAGMTWLDAHRLAIFTSGLHIVDTRSGATRNIFIPYHDKRYQWKFNIVMTAKGDSEGNVFLITRSGFYHFDRNYRLVFRFDYYKEAEVPVTHFFFGNTFGRDLYEFDKNRLIIIGADGLYLYDKTRKDLRKMTEADSPVMAEFLNYPHAFYSFFQPRPGCLFVQKSAHDTLVYIDLVKNRKVVSILPFKRLADEFHYRSKLIAIDDTTLYITGQFAGFYKMRFSPETGSVKLVTEKHFPSYLCYDILKDKDNTLWVATNKGLFHQDPTRSQVQIASIPTFVSDSAPNARVNDIKIIGENIYVAPYGVSGLLLFDKRTFQFNKLFTYKNSKPSSAFVNCVMPLDNTSLLLGTGGPMYRFNIATHHFTQIVPEEWEDGDWTNNFFKTRAGNIWMSCEKVYCYDPHVGQFLVQPEELHTRILRTNSFAEDAEGNIWLAGQGLCRYNLSLGKTDRSIDSFPYIKMPQISIGPMLADKQNNLWFGVYNNGLTCYNIQNGSFRHFTREDGLPANNITALILIGDRLWMAGNSSVACMDLRTSNIVRFGKEDGFPDLPIVAGAKFYYDSAAQQLYLGFSSMLARFNPFEILKKKQPPKLFVENLAFGEKDNFLPEGRITTSWRNNEARITIGSIDFADFNSQAFAYRILNDKAAVPWQQLGDQPSFSVSGLSPGLHKVQVKVFSLNNQWPEQIKEMSIVVLPPFWKTDWFVILMSVLTLVGLYFFITWRIHMVRKQEMEKTHIEKLKADDYKNQFELEQVTNYFSSSLANKKTEEEVLWDVAANLIGRMNYVDCIIYMWNRDKTKMVQKAAYGPKGKPEVISEQIFEVLPGEGIVGHAIQTRQPVIVSDTRTDSRYRVDDAFRLSEVCVPIIHNDELLGILDSEHHLPNYFSERDVKILTTIATLIGNKLKQIESEQSLEAKRQELANINEQLAEARLSALQAQMNPHFVFNALNSIKRMILDGDSEKASRYLSKFALMIRMTLNHSKDIFVTLDENIEYLKAYLEMEQLRFDDSFSYTIFTGANIDAGETSFPSLMIQPLVENAIWHGLLPARHEKRIMIRFTQCDNKIACLIEDNGIGIRESEKLKQNNGAIHHSLGLENIKKRIKIMNEKYDTNCTLEIIDIKDVDKTKRGTRVILQFNIINT